MLSSAVLNYTFEIKIMDFACQIMILLHKSVFALFAQIKKLYARKQIRERPINSSVGSRCSPEIQTRISHCIDQMKLSVKASRGGGK